MRATERAVKDESFHCCYSHFLWDLYSTRTRGPNGARLICLTRQSQPLSLSLSVCSCCTAAVWLFFIAARYTFWHSYQRDCLGYTGFLFWGEHFLHTPTAYWSARPGHPPLHLSPQTQLLWHKTLVARLILHLCWKGWQESDNENEWRGWRMPDNGGRANSGVSRRLRRRRQACNICHVWGCWAAHTVIKYTNVITVSGQNSLQHPCTLIQLPLWIIPWDEGCKSC